MYTVSFGIVTAGKNAIIKDRIFLNMFSPSFFYIHSFKNPPDNSPLLVWEMNRSYFILCVIGNNGSIYRYKFIYVIYNMYER